MRISKKIMAGCLVASVALSSCNKNDDDELNDQDRNYMVASISNNAEVNAATIASVKATNGAVKAFAQSMLMEHGMAQTDLKSLGTLWVLRLEIRSIPRMSLLLPS